MMLLQQRRKIKIFMDSGAHSWYNANVRGKTGGAREAAQAVYDSQLFWDYIDTYAEHLKNNQGRYFVSVSVDAIFNPEKSWEVQKYLENTHKLKVLPVYHFGEEQKWLELYMDNYEYFGIGGLGQEVQKTSYMRYADRIFKYLTDDKGTPIRKIHGFAMTSPELMIRYPWFTVDSSTWLIGEKYGLLMIPKIRNNKFDYGIPPLMLSVTTRKSKKKNHLSNVSELDKAHVLRYCKEQANFDYGKSDFVQVRPDYKLQDNEFWSNKKDGLVERVIEYGIGNSMVMRNTMNIKYFMGLQKFLSERPSKFEPEHEGLGLL